ncbi:uncharacterized protein LOC143153610 [Ptiloglossa arizonensis]|uniref:uncharacterized protein LOC143153610 n=1 Tax=Ptiloglossa arizonensis TaxID=3350558 RepID=UPI003F9FEF83
MQLQTFHDTTVCIRIIERVHWEFLRSQMWFLLAISETRKTLTLILYSTRRTLRYFQLVHLEKMLSNCVNKNVARKSHTCFDHENKSEEFSVHHCEAIESIYLFYFIYSFIKM